MYFNWHIEYTSMQNLQHVLDLIYVSTEIKCLTTILSTAVTNIGAANSELCKPCNELLILESFKSPKIDGYIEFNIYFNIMFNDCIEYSGNKCIWNSELCKPCNELLNLSNLL